ncbi:hypothetical protein BDQ17DRAFT_1267613, partial [Cyathus striatus]
LENPFSSIPSMVRALYPWMAHFAWDEWDALGLGMICTTAHPTTFRGSKTLLHIYLLWRSWWGCDVLCSPSSSPPSPSALLVEGS